MQLTTQQKWWVFTGLAALTLVGGIWWSRRRNKPPTFMAGSVPEAPAIDGYSDGDMKTTLRVSEAMGIEERLASIQKLVYKSVQDPQMRKLALQITSQCAERDGTCEARAVYQFVKENVRYTGDVAPIAFPDGSVDGIDLYQSARRTLEMHGGDCDDQSILVATLLSLNGITPRLRVIKERKRDDWSHIYPTAGLPKNEPSQWVPVDTTLPGSDHFGVEGSYADALDFPA